MIEADAVRLRPIRSCPFPLGLIALALDGLAFVPFYLLALMAVGWESLGYPPIPLPLSAGLYLLAYPATYFFLVPWRYVLASALGITLILAALRFQRSGRAIRSLLILALLAILAFPWLYRYEPALAAAPSHDLLVPTQPGLLEGVARRAQVAAERRPCTYSLLGWSVDGDLYYQATCEGQPQQVWVYAVARESSTRAVTRAPTDLVPESSPTSVLELVRAAGVRPAEHEPASRRLAIQGKALISPDGRWVALVARHVYGPENVLVVAR